MIFFQLNHLLCLIKLQKIANFQLILQSLNLFIINNKTPFKFKTILVNYFQIFI